MTDILIPNYNGRAALELCVESIARYTPEPHRVVVYDDASTADGERERIGEYVRVGLIDEAIFSSVHGGHGKALNVLMGAVESDCAVILDNDIQIMWGGWLPQILEIAHQPRTLAACDFKDTLGYCSRGFRPGLCCLWAGAVNMEAWRDGMAVDFAAEYADRREEPWLSMFAPLYPPEANDVFKHYSATQWEYGVDFDRDRVVFDPGAVLWSRVKHDNPRGYAIRPLTAPLRLAFRHWQHAQHHLGNQHEPQSAAMACQIRAELKRLREGK